jgi:hypothetical protein
VRILEHGANNSTQGPDIAPPSMREKVGTGVPKSSPIQKYFRMYN